MFCEYFDFDFELVNRNPIKLAVTVPWKLDAAFPPHCLVPAADCAGLQLLCPSFCTGGSFVAAFLFRFQDLQSDHPLEITIF